MAFEVVAAGELIAVEGGRGPEMMAAAKRVRRRISLSRSDADCGISEWGASNLFVELKLGASTIPGPSARALVLLYATDLAFRLHWEIKPALKEGRVVVAVPYVQSAIAFGKATGLSRRWLVELFRFAPRPIRCYRVKEHKESAASGKPLDGFLEFCCVALSRASPPWDPAELRKGYDSYLDALERSRGCQTLTDRVLAAAGSRL